MNNPAEQSFWGHLDEFVRRFFRTCLVLLFAAVCVYRLIDPLLAFLLEPVGKVIFTNPSDAFVSRVQLSLWGALFLTLPYILFEIWQFVSTALHEHERRHVLFYGPLSLAFFLTGAVFAYCIVIPFTMKFFLGFATDDMVPMITIKNYVSFVGTTLLGFGVAFELPLILMFLAKIGIATPEFLRQQRRYAVVIILIVSATITPPDLISLWLMSVPLILLYEIGILMIQWSKRHAPSPTYESAQ